MGISAQLEHTQVINTLAPKPRQMRPPHRRLQLFGGMRLLQVTGPWEAGKLLGKVQEMPEFLEKILVSA